MSATTLVSHTFHLPVHRPVAFELFSEPRALDQLTPSWFRLEPSAPVPRPLAAGVEIRYRLRWRGLPLGWTSRLTDWREPDFLAYEQARGPFRYFRHEHLFRPVDGGTEIEDRALFRGPGGRLVDRLVVGPELQRIFACRERRARALLRAIQPATGAEAEPSRMPCTSARSSAIERPT